MKPVRFEHEGLVHLPWHDEGLLICLVHLFLNLVGEPGTGKTTFARALAKLLTGKEPVVLAGSPEIEQVHFFGYERLVDGSMHWADGGLWKALKEQRWLLIEDADKVPIDSRGALLQLRGATHVTNPLNQEVLPVPPADPDNVTFRVIMTSNLESLRCNRNAALARALYSDVITLEVPELSRSDMTRFLKSRFPQCSAQQLRRALDVWDDYRQISSKSISGAAEQSLTYRACEHLVKLQLCGMASDRAIANSIVTKFMMDKDLYDTAKLKAMIE